ncbi:hypothetical protein ABIA99_002457 [Bradyrhizobium sp. LB12.1]
MRRDWVRAPLLLLGLVGVLWFYATLPSIWLAAPVRDVTARILSDDRFKSGTLSKLVAQIAVRPSLMVEPSDFVRGEALILLRTSEEMIGRKSPEDADRKVEAATDKVKYSLSVNPTDAFLWLMLYSTAISRDGLDFRNIKYLDQSYVIAPFEGWIVLRRNRVGLALFQSLSEATQQNVLTEFGAMINSGFIDDAAMNLEGVGWAERDRLLTTLERANEIPREAFARRLARDGVKAIVPGVEIDQRSWR